MVIEYIRYQIPVDRHAEFIDAYRSAQPFFPNIREMQHHQPR